MKNTITPEPVVILGNKMTSYRWIICSLLFFATTVNYLDRTVISLLKGTLEKEFTWTEGDYADIVIAFQFAYAIGMLIAGRVVDKIGTKMGYALSIFLWSIAAMAHALVSSTFGFLVARASLGVTEAGNFPAAIKTTAEWFPKKERAFATGIFNSGTNIGAILAPLSVPFIAAQFGWRWAFIITGGFGFLWLIFWFLFYEKPAKQKRLGKAEFDFIHSDQDEVKPHEDQGRKVSWIELLGFRQTWSFIMGKLFTDPIWWFYLFWLPAFLKAQYNIEGTAAALPVAAVYTLSSVGSIFGGWLPLWFIKKGWPVFRSRKTSMLIYAFGVIPVVFAQYLGQISMWWAVLIIGIATAAHQAWSANMFTTVSDMFPKKAIGSVIGIGGFAGALGGMAFAFGAGKLFDYYKALGTLQVGYYIVFIVCGCSYLIAWLIMHMLVPRMQKAPI
jgi:ACS family hexuronate transporter-like MFS transporter